MKSGGPLENLTNTGIGTTSLSNFSVIIPPKGGHGYDVYRELGAYRNGLYILDLRLLKLIQTLLRVMILLELELLKIQQSLVVTLNY